MIEIMRWSNEDKGRRALTLSRDGSACNSGLCLDAVKRMRLSTPMRPLTIRIHVLLAEVSMEMAVA